MDEEQYEIMYHLEREHWWYKGMRRISTALLETALPNTRPLTVLDAGCGTGGTTESLVSYGRVVGLDFSPLALGLAKKRSLGDWLRGTVSSLPFADASFDLVTSFDVLYHLGVEDDLCALREFYRVLKPGGAALIRNPALEFLRGRHDQQVHTRHRYTAGEIRSKVSQAGLRPIRATYANAFLLPLVAAVRSWQRISGAREGSDLRSSGGAAGGILKSALYLEAELIRKGVDMPLGLSVFCLARKE